MSDLKRAEPVAMCDPSWLSASQLRITPTEYAALIQVRDMLLDGKLKHLIANKRNMISQWLSGRTWIFKLPAKRAEVGLFNMAWPMVSLTECDTAHCIGGWMHKVMGRTDDVKSYVMAGRSQALHSLFYPNMEMTHISVLQTAQAAGNFLSTGDPQWRNTTKS